jgi:hypothetical protein
LHALVILSMNEDKMLLSSAQLGSNRVSLELDKVGSHEVMRAHVDQRRGRPLIIIRAFSNFNMGRRGFESLCGHWRAVALKCFAISALDSSHTRMRVYVFYTGD